MVNLPLRMVESRIERPEWRSRIVMVFPLRDSETMEVPDDVRKRMNEGYATEEAMRTDYNRIRFPGRKLILE